MNAQTLPWKNDGRLFLLTEKEFIELGVAVIRVDFEIPEKWNESGGRKGKIDLEGTISVLGSKLDQLGGGETLEVLVGLCGNPYLYDPESVLLRFSDCRLQSKRIVNPVVCDPSSLKVLSMEIVLDCWIEVIWNKV
jgi:hypothetical protein